MLFSAVLASSSNFGIFDPMVPPWGQNVEIAKTAQNNICCAEFRADREYVGFMGSKIYLAVATVSLFLRKQFRFY